MTNSMTYKGYSARIEYDDDDGIFTGRIAGIRDGVGFHADSGKVMFRVDPEVHRKAALAAELSGKSLNQWAEEVLDRATG